jgi:superfamily I DNA/RNA helicase
LDALFPEDDILFDQIRELFVDELDKGLSLPEIKNQIWEKMFEPNFPDEVDYVRLMTLYGCKGLGSPIVYVTSLVDGLLPSRPDVEDTPVEVARKEQEQRRLFYVALTRVKSMPSEDFAGELIISSFRSFSYADAHSLNNGSTNALASRFLNELGPMAPQAERR